MRPRLTPDRAAVQLPSAPIAATVVDEIAAAYRDDPATLTALLAAHAEAAAADEHATGNPFATDYERAMRAAEADATREALLDELDTGGIAAGVLGSRDAFRLADDLTALAARITIQHQNGPHL